MVRNSPYFVSQLFLNTINLTRIPGVTAPADALYTVSISCPELQKIKIKNFTLVLKNLRHSVLLKYFQVNYFHETDVVLINIYRYMNNCIGFQRLHWCF